MRNTEGSNEENLTFFIRKDNLAKLRYCPSIGYALVPTEYIIDVLSPSPSSILFLLHFSPFPPNSLPPLPFPLLISWDRVSLFFPGWPETHCVDLKLTKILSAYASRIWGLKGCTPYLAVDIILKAASPGVICLYILFPHVASSRSSPLPWPVHWHRRYSFLSAPLKYVTIPGK